MSKPVVLADDFSGGAYQDAPRHQLPKGKAWQVTDMFPDLDGTALIKRGGWTRSFSAMSATSSSYAAAVGFAPFSGGARALGIDEDGRLYTWQPGVATTTNVGAARVPAHPPTFYRNKSYICDVNGASSMYSYDGSTLAAASGSPPTAAVSAVYKDHLVLGYTSANPNRVWFSNAGDPTTWDTAANGQWLDCSGTVRGLATLRNMVIVFQDGFTERLRGDIIPGVVGSDFVREPLFNIGCPDPASIAVMDDYVIFANEFGVFMTDGIGVVNLTKQCGMSEYWFDVMGNYTSDVTIAGAMYKDWYVVAATSGTGGTSRIAAAINVSKRVWITLTNIKPSMMVSTGQGNFNLAGAYLWMAEMNAPYVSDLSPMWYGTGGNAADGDSTVVTGSWESPFYIGRPGKKRFKKLYVTYNSGGSTLTASYLTDRHGASDSGTYTALSTTLSTTTVATRKPITLSKFADGIAVKLAFSGSGQSCAVYSLEADMYAAEPGRV